MAAALFAAAAHPERMTTALDTFFRMESVDAMLRSVVAGIRKYQNPAVAELLAGLIADTSTDRDKLRQYLVDLPYFLTLGWRSFTL